jgi:hypothetical protein
MGELYFSFIAIDWFQFLDNQTGSILLYTCRIHGLVANIRNDKLLHQAKILLLDQSNISAKYFKTNVELNKQM